MRPPVVSFATRAASSLSSTSREKRGTPRLPPSSTRELVAFAGQGTEDSL